MSRSTRAEWSDTRSRLRRATSHAEFRQRVSEHHCRFSRACLLRSFSRHRGAHAAWVRHRGRLGERDRAGQGWELVHRRQRDRIERRRHRDGDRVVGRDPGVLADALMVDWTARRPTRPPTSSSNPKEARNQLWSKTSNAPLRTVLKHYLHVGDTGRTPPSPSTRKPESARAPPARRLCAAV